MQTYQTSDLMDGDGGSSTEGITPEFGSVERYWEDAEDPEKKINVMLTVRCIFTTLAFSHHKRSLICVGRVPISRLTKDIFKRIAIIAFKLTADEIKPLHLEVFCKKLPKVLETVKIDPSKVYIDSENGVLDIKPTNYQSWINIDLKSARHSLTDPSSGDDQTTREDDSEGAKTVQLTPKADLDWEDQNKIHVRIGGISRFTEVIIDRDAGRSYYRGNVYTSKNGERFDGLHDGKFIPPEGSRLPPSRYYYKLLSFPKEIDMMCKIITAVILDTHDMPQNHFPDRHRA